MGHSRECKLLNNESPSPIPLFPAGIELTNYWTDIEMGTEAARSQVIKPPHEYSILLLENEGSASKAHQITTISPIENIESLHNKDDIVISTEKLKAVKNVYFTNFVGLTGGFQKFKILPPSDVDYFTVKALCARIIQCIQATYFLEDQMATKYLKPDELMASQFPDMAKGLSNGPFNLSMSPYSSFRLEEIFFDTRKDGSGMEVSGGFG